MITMQDPLIPYLGQWAAELDIPSILLRLGLCLFCAAVLGCERSQKRHSAGLRTFILSSLAGTIGMMLDIAADGLFGNFPVISASVVIGIAIITSNTILFSAKSQIKGLTTSVALWLSSLLGLAFGAGLYTMGLLVSLATWGALAWFPPFEKYLKDRSNHFEVHLELKSKYNLQDFVTTIRRLGLVIDDIESNPAYINSGLSVYTVAITISSEELKKYKTHREIIQALRCLDYIYYIDEL